jgi:hypothetical protein
MGLPIDGNNRAVQTAQRAVYQDAQETPKVSPLTVSSTALEIVPPTDAILFSARAVGADVRVGDNATLDGTEDEGYTLLPDGEWMLIPVANGASLHVVRDDDTDAELYFHFEVL